MGDKRLLEHSAHAQSVQPYSWNNPGKAIDRNGRIVETSGSLWKLNHESDDLIINWNLVNHVGQSVKESMKARVFHTIEKQSPTAAYTVYCYLKYVLETHLPVATASELTPAAFERVLVTLRKNKTDWKLGHVRRWYRWCSDRQVPGFDPEIADQFYQYKLSANPTGYAVMSRDPEKGPLDDLEHWLLRRAVKERRGSLTSRVCVMILLELGARPGQVVLLNQGDFQVEKSIKGRPYYSLTVPRLKQGTINKFEKKRRKISDELGEQLGELIKTNHHLYGDSSPETPLLYCSSQESCLPKRITRAMFRYWVVKYPLETGVISPRTSEPLDLNPYRLRYTFATRHANQGTPAVVLAELLDHSNTNSVSIYTKSVSSVVERLDKAVGANEEYADILGHFIGRVKPRPLNGSLRSMVYGTTPTLKNLGGIGSCGATFLCDLMPPLSCYVCPKFQAWDDAPHHEMLREVELYVQKLITNSGNPSDRIPHQLSQTINAIKALLLILNRKQTGKQLKQSVDGHD